MKGEQHLTRPEQYERVYKQGKSWANSLLVMKVAPNSLDLSRYGLSVSRRVGKAVVRNKTKRRLREIVRAAPLKPGWDIIFIARPPIASAQFAAINEAATSLLCRARLMVEGPVAYKQ